MFEIKEIMEKLPHRYPFLLVDRVLEIEKDKKLVGIKNVTYNEPFFPGHFPGVPIMPGVLMVEAMAQAAGILAIYSLQTDKRNIFFMSIEKAKFRRPVVPGDQLRMEISVLQKRGDVWRFSGAATVEDKVVSEAEFTAMLSGKEL